MSLKEFVEEATAKLENQKTTRSLKKLFRKQFNIPPEVGLHWYAEIPQYPLKDPMILLNFIFRGYRLAKDQALIRRLYTSSLGDTKIIGFRIRNFDKIELPADKVESMSRNLVVPGEAKHLQLVGFSMYEDGRLMCLDLRPADTLLSYPESSLKILSERMARIAKGINVKADMINVKGDTYVYSDYDFVGESGKRIPYLRAASGERASLFNLAKEAISEMPSLMGSNIPHAHLDAVSVYLKNAHEHEIPSEAHVSYLNLRRKGKIGIIILDGMQRVIQTLKNFQLRLESCNRNI